jgi:acetyltransferase EpsM
MNLIIYGAGGHAKVVGETAHHLTTYKKIIFVDPYLKDFVFTQYDPSFSFVPFHSLLDIAMPSYSICAIGDNALRRQVILAHAKDSFASVISNEAIVSKFCNISPGVFIAPGAVVNADASIGSHSIINTSSVIEHDCKISSFCHIAPNAALGGNVFLGENVLVGGNTFINPNLSICSDVVIGSGSVVTKDLSEPGLYVGTPAKKIA